MFQSGPVPIYISSFRFSGREPDSMDAAEVQQLIMPSFDPLQASVTQLQKDKDSVVARALRHLQGSFSIL